MRAGLATRADWRHYTVAAIALAAALVLLWSRTVGSDRAFTPTGNAPAGSRPIAASPDSP